MAFLLPKRTNSDGFRITNKLYNKEETSHSITNTFYLKAASLPFSLQDKCMYAICRDVNPVDEYATCFTTI